MPRKPSRDKFFGRLRRLIELRKLTSGLAGNQMV